MTEAVDEGEGEQKVLEVRVSISKVNIVESVGKGIRGGRENRINEVTKS